MHAWLDGNNERAGLAAALAGVPRIIISGRNMNPTHFAYYRPYMEPAYRALLSIPQVTMLNNCLAGSNDYAVWLGIDQNRIRVIHNGINFVTQSRHSAGATAALRQSLSLDSDAFVVGGVFRFAAEKRPLLWLQTAAEIAGRLANARFVIFGHGEMRAEMEKSVQDLGLGTRLIFAGVTEDILRALSVMDVLLLTSIVEGLPNVVLEAQWVGTPVVGTRAGGIAEAVEPGVSGWIVEPASPAELADRVLWLHNHPIERATARARGPALVKRKFGIGRMIDETLDVYELPHSSARAIIN